MFRCPICHFKKTHTKYKVGKYQYYECGNCKTLFLYPLPSSSSIKRYYSSAFEYIAGRAEESRIRKRANIILKKLKHLHPEGKTLLDIGSGYGYFLEEAKKISLDSTGIEPNKKLAQSSVFRGTLDEFVKKSNSNKFDFITAIHVIEHIRNPFTFIKQVSRLLNRGGILYIETPNYNSWLAQKEKEQYTFLTPPDHIWLFSKKSLQLIKLKFPRLSIVSINTYSYPEHLMGIIKRQMSFLRKQESRRRPCERNV